MKSRENDPIKEKIKGKTEHIQKKRNRRDPKVLKNEDDTLGAETDKKKINEKRIKSQWMELNSNSKKGNQTGRKGTKPKN